jgi:hypothetical protein
MTDDMIVTATPHDTSPEKNPKHVGKGGVKQKY